MKTILKRIAAGTLAAVFLATFAIPRAKAVTGVDDTTLGIMAVIVHLQSIGGELAVTQGTALATTDAVTSLATQAGVAGALGAGVTGATALAAIGAAVTAAAGGFTIGYAGYETLSKLAEWIRQSKLTGTAENKIFQTGGAWNTSVDGTSLYGVKHNFGQVLTTQAGTTFWVENEKKEEDGVTRHAYVVTAVNSKGQIQTSDSGYYRESTMPSPDKVPYYYVRGLGPDYINLYYEPSGSYQFSVPYPTYPEASKRIWFDFFAPQPDTTYEKQEVTYAPPATWSQPAPSLGQDVLYQPYPNQPDKSLTDIAQDVPKDIYDKKLQPLPPVVVTPETPPVPDIPPVNPNPDVEAPEDVAPYTVKIGEVFPFCIPFDLYHMVTMFDAEPEAPHAKWEFSLPWSPQQQYKVEWNLKEFDSLAELCRKLELVLFCVGLAVITSRLIKW